MNEANRIDKKRRAKLLGEKKKSNPVLSLIMHLAAVAFVIYCAMSFIGTKAETADRRHELVALNEQAAVLEVENEEYQAILSEDDERAYMERIAIDTLGYAYPNERRFYDTTRN